MNQTISIRAIASTSALGATAEDCWNSYQSPAHCLNIISTKTQKLWGGAISAEVNKELEDLRLSTSKYGQLDRSVLLAILTARRAIERSGWGSDAEAGINIGSSRGATSLFEKYHQSFLQKGRTPTLTSPTTTLGNISSWVGHDLKLKGPEISHSITCSTSLHAVLNAIAWIRGGMSKRFLAGGSEASLTPFTISQMQALKIYAENPSGNIPDYPCRALDLEKRSNSMVLGEAASIACLELGSTEDSLAIIEGYGYASELLQHNVSLSAQADCLQESMKMAMSDLSPKDIDVVVLHAPGTIKGDQAEIKAIDTIFGSDQPALTSNKWKIGHCLGASGMLSIDMAIHMLQHQEFIAPPYLKNVKIPDKLERILVNAVGFGGNAVSILLKRV